MLQFENDGFLKQHIKSTSIVRKELSRQLQNANFKHYTPHTIRNSLAALLMAFPLTPEQLKAASQNMSHKNLATTMGYGHVHEYRQDAIIEELNIEAMTKLQKLKNNPKYQFIISQMNNEEAINKVFKVISKDC
jgi:integrase